MRRFGVLLLTIGLVAVAAPVIAQDFDPHPHMLVQRPEVGFIEVDDAQVLALTGFRKCVDLAGGKSVPLHAHHEMLHFGKVGQKLFEKAGHVVVPAAPFPEPFFEALPWSNCAEFEALLPIPLPEEDDEHEE